MQFAREIYHWRKKATSKRNFWGKIGRILETQQLLYYVLLGLTAIQRLLLSFSSACAKVLAIPCSYHLPGHGINALSLRSEAARKWLMRKSKGRILLRLNQFSKKVMKMTKNS